MTVRPGVNVSILEQSTPIAVSTDTGTLFAVGLTDRGPSDIPELIQSLDGFTTIYGARQSYSVLYDSIETYFREGGNRVYMGRVVGPSATKGTRSLLDSGAGNSLTVNAIGPGAWSSSYKVGVVAGQGSNFQIQVTDASNVVLEQSSDLADQNAAVAWSNYSNFIRIVLGSTALNPAVVAPAALSAGTDDRNNIVDAQWATAKALFNRDLGPGQIIAPGRTSSAAYSQLVAHAEANNRDAILDYPNTATAATLKSSAASVVSRFSAGFAPWVVIPGLTAGTTRTVPPSAFIAGLIARNDPSLGPNAPAAGIRGLARFVIDISQPDWSDTVRSDLNDNNVNVIRRMSGGIRNYGWRSNTNAVSDAGWIDFGNARLYTSLAAEFDNAGENYMFSEIDGQNGVTVNGFHDALVGICIAHYNAGELFGDTADKAFAVDTGPSVNTLVTIAANELHAVVRVRMAPMAEMVAIQIVKRLVTQTV